jgi:hypothetical protein
MFLCGKPIDSVAFGARRPCEGKLTKLTMLRVSQFGGPTPSSRPASGRGRGCVSFVGFVPLRAKRSEWRDPARARVACAREERVRTSSGGGGGAANHRAPPPPASRSPDPASAANTAPMTRAMKIPSTQPRRAHRGQACEVDGPRRSRRSSNSGLLTGPAGRWTRRRTRAGRRCRGRTSRRADLPLRPLTQPSPSRGEGKEDVGVA